MATLIFGTHQCRINFLLAAILMFAVYALFIEPRQHRDPFAAWYNGDIDLSELEEELDCYNPVHVVEYRSPLDERIFQPRGNLVASDRGTRSGGVAELSKNFNDMVIGLDELPTGASSNAAKFHRVWTMADRLIDRRGLWPTGDDRPEMATILEAMSVAPIVGVDVLDIGDYESGTADKWIATLAGGQKVVMKLSWGDSGKMKKNAECNTGFEMPSAEIAAFHLHRIIGFNNTPYVTGRRIDVRREIVPHASRAVSKQIALRDNNETCISGTCYNCKTSQMLCRDDGVFEFSLAYWVPRKMRLYTFPPKYMPFSTPRMDEWGQIGFNNRSYCEKTQQTIQPYDQRSFYLDLFDFAVVDTLMYHYDSKHYSVVDRSDADGLVVRLDHGRAFCAHDRDDEQIFLAPITQCCTLRRSTYKTLQTLKDGRLTKKLKALLKTDPLAPVLEKVWYPALERRMKLILTTLDRCISARGRDDVLVDDSDAT